MEIAIISGKGGTGKSSISAAFATILPNVVLADCDVDAANLYILFNPQITYEEVYIAGEKAEINYNKCCNCGLCINYCNFEAISIVNKQTTINEVLCDGCKLCSRICPSQAIKMIKNDKSRMYAGDYEYGKMVYGRLAPGEENSGKLVNKVRDKAKEITKENNFNNIIIDGPPGIGCPVISTITGVDCIVIVTEPTISGLQDLKRTIEVTSKFQSKKVYVIINKYDLNNDITKQIQQYCNEVNIEVISKLPFDKIFVEAMVNKKSIIQWKPDSSISIELEKVFNKIISNN